MGAPDGLVKGALQSWHFAGRTPEKIGGFMEKLVQWMDTHPEQITKERLAILCAWNEMGEGSRVVPCKDDPDGEFFCEFLPHFVFLDLFY